MDLPDDIKIHIYTFLHMNDVKKIEKTKYIYKTLIEFENRSNPKNLERIFRNAINNECFNCTNKLTNDYIMNICGE